MQKEVLISGLRQQRDLLKDLLVSLEMKEVFQTEDTYYRSLLEDIERNLRKLRRWVF